MHKPTARWYVGTATYVGLIAALTWQWSGRSGGGFSLAEAATFVLLLPAMLVLIPVTYVVLAGVWAVTGGSVDQGIVPPVVIVSYVVWFALLAVTNAVLLTAAVRVLHTRRSSRPRDGLATS